MSKFEKMMESEPKSPEERMAMLAEIKKICATNCGSCPSYTGSGETDFGFCATGKSTIITEEKGCTCIKCPVTDMYGLEWGYYCTRGSSIEQFTAGKK